VDGGVSDGELADAILLASRAMVGVAVRSLSAADREITLPQYRTLVVLSYRGNQRLAELASNLAVSPSTATRMCDRLVRKGLITRSRDTLDRREVDLCVSDEGRRLVEKVMERRRQEVQAMVASIPAEARPRLVSSLQLLARSVGEVPEMHWAPGWRAEEQPAGSATASNGGSDPDEEGLRPPSG
jgi:DNA-binding MarR family transcriptional regulator